MASSWKLTKKLKETNFLRGHTSTSAASSNDDSQISPAPSGTSTDLNSINGSQAHSTGSSHYGSHSGSRGSPKHSRDTLVAGHGSTPGESRTNTLTAGRQTSPRTTVTRGGTADAHANQQSILSANNAGSSITAASQAAPKSTSANPGLLRVKVYELKQLVVPKQHMQQVPTWAFDKSSTKPPPVHLVLEYDKTQILLHAIGGTVEEPVWDKTTAFDVAANASSVDLNVCVYLRVRESSISDDSSSKKDSSSSDSSKEQFTDVPLDATRVTPEHMNSLDMLPLAGGTLSVKCELQNTKNQPLSIDDFTLLKVIGKGSFGKVMQVRKNDTRQIYALKTIRKAHIVSKSEVVHTLAERTVLAKINNPFIVPLKFSFQSPEKLYLVIAFVNGGELFHHLQREGRFDLNRARFYTAELLCALECLHEYNVIYRDLKPENILLDYTGHIALCDFGLCKLNMGSKDQTSTFCGTPEYLAPELLLGQGYTKSVDWWTLGVLFYEMLTGLPPFYDQNTNTMYHKIVKDPLTFPADMDREAKSLITGLLDRDPRRRLGANGAADIKAHPFFHQIDWKYLLNKKYAAPFLPSVASAIDTSNFDQEFTSEVPMDSVVGKEFYLSDSVQNKFGGWSYTNDSRLASSGKW